MLGISWNATKYMFAIQVVGPVMSEKHETKCTFLSNVAIEYDQCSWLFPFVIVASSGLTDEQLINYQLW